MLYSFLWWGQESPELPALNKRLTSITGNCLMAAAAPQRERDTDLMELLQWTRYPAPQHKHQVIFYMASQEEQKWTKMSYSRTSGVMSALFPKRKDSVSIRKLENLIQSHLHSGYANTKRKILPWNWASCGLIHIFWKRMVVFGQIIWYCCLTRSHSQHFKFRGLVSGLKIQTMKLYLPSGICFK